MKKGKIVLLICALAGAVLLAACLFGGPDAQPFDEETEGIVKVETRAKCGCSGRKTGTKQYYTLAQGKRRQETAPFTPEGVESWDFPMDDWHRELVGDALTDSQGRLWPMDEELYALADRIVALDDHAGFVTRLMIADGEWFVYRELNVNLFSPCELYHYDRQDRHLTELYTFNGEEVTAVSVMRPQALGQGQQ